MRLSDWHAVDDDARSRGFRNRKFRQDTTDTNRQAEMCLVLNLIITVERILAKMPILIKFAYDLHSCRITMASNALYCIPRARLRHDPMDAIVIS